MDAAIAAFKKNWHFKIYLIFAFSVAHSIALFSLDHLMAIWLWISLVVLLSTAYMAMYFRGPKIKLDKSMLLIVFIGTTLTPAVLETDHHRYIWDGLVALSGENPYRYSPENYQGIMGSLSIRERINHPSLNTIYPPLAQALFSISGLMNPFFWPAMISSDWSLLNALSTWQWELGWKILVGTTAVITAIAYQKERWELILTHPLFVLQFLINGHLDGFLVMMIFWVGFSRHGFMKSTLAITAGIALKIYPLILLPFSHRFYKLKIFTTFATILLLLFAYIPYLPGSQGNLFSSLITFGQHWTFFGYWHAILVDVLKILSLPGDPIFLAKIVLAAIGFVVALLLLSAYQKNDLEKNKVIYYLLFCFWSFSPTLHPWYLMVLIPLIIKYKNTHSAGLIWSLVCLFSIATYLENKDPTLLRYTLYSLVTLAFSLELRKDLLAIKERKYAYHFNHTSFERS